MVWGMFLLLINVGSLYKGQKRQKALLNYRGWGGGWVPHLLLIYPQQEGIRSKFNVFTD